MTEKPSRRDPILGGLLLRERYALGWKELIFNEELEAELARGAQPPAAVASVLYGEGLCVPGAWHYD